MSKSSVSSPACSTEKEFDKVRKLQKLGKLSELAKSAPGGKNPVHEGMGAAALRSSEGDSSDKKEDEKGHSLESEEKGALEAEGFDKEDDKEDDVDDG